MRSSPPASCTAEQEARGALSTGWGNSGGEISKRAPPIGPRDNSILVGSPTNEPFTCEIKSYSANKNKNHELRIPVMRNPTQITPLLNSGTHGTAGKSRSVVYRLLLLIVAAILAVETLMQGSIWMLMGRTNILNESRDLFSRPLVRPKRVIEESVKFVPHKILERLVLSKGRTTVAELRNQSRAPIRPPQLAVVCPNLGINPQSLYVLTVTKGLQLLGYKLEVLSLEEGDLRFTYENMGVQVSHIEVDPRHGAIVDWLNYEGVIAVSLNSKVAVTSLARTPFRSIPVIWVIMSDALGAVLGAYETAGAKSLVYDWARSFKRAAVVVFPNYALPMVYTSMDVENFYVIPGSPMEVWESKVFMATHNRAVLRTRYLLEPEHYVISVVGSPFLHAEIWKEHAVVMRALLSAVSEMGADVPQVHLFVLGHGNSSSKYSFALQAMAHSIGLGSGVVEYVGVDYDVQGVLWMSDVVLYASLQDEQAFPPVLTRAMSLQRPVIVPNRTAFQDHIKDGVNGLLYPLGDHLELSKALVRIKLGQTTRAMALVGEATAQDLLAVNVTLGYGKLLENFIQFPGEVELPRQLEELSKVSDRGWCWDLMTPLLGNQKGEGNAQMRVKEVTKKMEGLEIVSLLEDQWAQRAGAAKVSLDVARAANRVEEAEIVQDVILEHAKLKELEHSVARIEKEELVERNEPRAESWEEITKSLRKTEVHRDRLREFDNLELERTGQPLTIYEPYYGTGAWPFLHEGDTLYRAISLSTVGRRPGDDDVDAQVRLNVILNQTYYRNLLCDHGAIFAMGNRIDRIHKNAWIGFQPWRSLSRNVALSQAAEVAVGKAVRTGRHGDALYFWASSRDSTGDSDMVDSKQRPNDFWTNCDSMNAGNCRNAFLVAMKGMYGLPADWIELPPMPPDGDPWSALNCWILPTPSFVELVLFARMFVDALDSQYYVEHHERGECCLARSKHEGKHCYCQLLESLVNVWAYHSARHMIYVDPQSGVMKEVHRIESRQGHLWIKWFSKATLKAMDDDLAEAMVDGDRSNDHWLWPLTGEVFWMGIADLEREERHKLKAKKQMLYKERILRLKERRKFKSLGKFVKPKAQRRLPTHT